MAQVIVTPQATRDVEGAISALNLPDDTWPRIARALQVLEIFPLSGRKVGDHWDPARFVLGPWQWMLLLYTYDASADRVYVVAMHDARSATSATAH